MNWLARLKNIECAPESNLQNLQKGDSGAFVGFVGERSKDIQYSGSDDIALPDSLAQPANDPAAPADVVAARVAVFTDRGLSLKDAQELADRLAARDLDVIDDRRVCLECLNLSGTVTSRRCGAWRLTGNGSPSVPADLADILQRCAGFKAIQFIGGSHHAKD